ncbi:TGF-beta ligand glass bottom boat protein [Sarcoptes scabiei]|nr:TGF-beta ligand glass bottom boat protein [Sarcoptes scabiei]
MGICQSCVRPKNAAARIKSNRPIRMDGKSSSTRSSQPSQKTNLKMATTKTISVDGEEKTVSISKSKSKSKLRFKSKSISKSKSKSKSPKSDSKIIDQNLLDFKKKSDIIVGKNPPSTLPSTSPIYQPPPSPVPLKKTFLPKSPMLDATQPSSDKTSQKFGLGPKIEHKPQDSTFFMNPMLTTTDSLLLSESKTNREMDSVLSAIQGTESAFASAPLESNLASSANLKASYLSDFNSSIVESSVSAGATSSIAPTMTNLSASVVSNETVTNRRKSHSNIPSSNIHSTKLLSSNLSKDGSTIGAESKIVAAKTEKSTSLNHSAISLSNRQSKSTN